jgi:hypothetical protein
VALKSFSPAVFSIAQPTAGWGWAEWGWAKQPSRLAGWGWAEWGWVVTTATVVQSQTTDIYIHIQVVIDRLLPPNLLTALFEVTSSIPVVQALTGLNNVILKPISSVRYQDF